MRSPFGIPGMSGGIGRGFSGGGARGFGEIPEPDEELPDSDLSDGERQAAIQRERWRRDGNR